MNELNNILAVEWENRYILLSDEVKRQLDILDDVLTNHIKGYDYFQLRYIKRSYKQIRKGDVFVFSPRDDIYFGGYVLNTIPQENEPSDKIVVLLFKNKTNCYSSFKFEIDVNNLLIPPAIVSKLYWTKGMFYNIGHIENLNLKFDYGFYDYMELKRKGRYLDEYGNVQINKPQCVGAWGVYTDIGIAHAVNKELIIDNSLLTFE